MHIAALPERTYKRLEDCLLESFVVVGNDKLYAVQSTLCQADQEIAPGRPSRADFASPRADQGAAQPTMSMIRRSCCAIV